MATENESKTFIDLPPEILDCIGHYLMQEQADIHIESSDGSTPTFSYKACSEEAEELSKNSMLSHKSGADSLLKAYPYDINSFGLTCKQLCKVAESVRFKQSRGCIFDQTTFEKFNTSVETNTGNAKPFSRVQLILGSFEISFLKKLPSTYLWKVGRLEIFLLEPDAPDKSTDLQKLLPFKQVNERVYRPWSTRQAKIAWESWLTANSFDKELSIPIPRFHRHCPRRILEGQAGRSKLQAQVSKRRERISKLQAWMYSCPEDAPQPPLDNFSAFMKERGYI